MKILIVDDMITMRKIVRNQLTKAGYTDLTEASDGQTAIDTIKDKISAGEKFDLIISDWSMPGVTGLDLLKFVRGTSGIETTPFILVTAESEQKNIIEAIKEKVTNYIVKPFTPETFQDKVKKIIVKIEGEKKEKS